MRPLAAILVISATLTGHIDPAVLAVVAVGALLIGARVGSRHAVRRNGVQMIRAGAFRLRTGRFQ